MAARGRDLKVSILSDVDKFDLSKPAEELETLGENAKDAGREISDMEDIAKDSGRALDTLGDDAEKADKSLDSLSKEGKETAEKLDSAFDKIAKSSRSNLRNKLDDDSDAAKRSLNDVGDEANDTAREMAASFDGSFDSILDAAQELTANAGAAFGPAGAAISAALGVGLGMFFADFKKKQEEMKEAMDELVAEMIENNGEISEEFINSRIENLGIEKIKELTQVAEDANVTVDNLIRAYAGSPDDIAIVNAQLEANAKNLKKVDAAAAANDPTMQKFFQATKTVREGLGLQEDALAQTTEAYNVMRSAMGKPVVPKVNGRPAVDAADNVRKRIEGSLGRPVTTPVHISPPSAREIDAVNRAIRRGIGTIVVPVKPGQSRFTNTSSNSRYRN